MKIRGGNPRIVSSGLKLHYDIQNPYSYPGSGTLIRDISGNGKDGTMTTATIGTANAGYMTFTGTEYITFNAPLDQIPENQQWTVQAWVKASPKGSYQYLLENWNRDLGLEWSSTTKPLNYLNSGDNDSYTYGTVNQLTTGNWLLATFAFDRVNYDPGRVTIQANTDSEVVGGNVNSTDIPYGFGSTMNMGRYMVGNIMNLLIYDRKLTADEVTQNYNAQKTRYGI